MYNMVYEFIEVYSVTPYTGLSEMRTLRLSGQKYKVPIVDCCRRTYLTNLWFTDTSIFHNADIYPCSVYINTTENTVFKADNNYSRSRKEITFQLVDSSRIFFNRSQ